jgi:hypothetical protein
VALRPELPAGAGEWPRGRRVPWWAGEWNGRHRRRMLLRGPTLYSALRWPAALTPGPSPIRTPGRPGEGSVRPFGDFPLCVLIHPRLRSGGSSRPRNAENRQRRWLQRPFADAREAAGTYSAAAAGRGEESAISLQRRSICGQGRPHPDPPPGPPSPPAPGEGRPRTAGKCEKTSSRDDFQRRCCPV